MGLAIIDKGLTVFGELDKNRVPTLVTVVVAERADLEMRYDGLLLYELGMHMLMMGPNLGKQLMDAKNQLVQTAEEVCHGATTDETVFAERHHAPAVGPGHPDGQHRLIHGQGSIPWWR